MLNLIALQLDREGIKGRQDGEKVGEGAIIRGRRLIEGRLLFEEIRYFKTMSDSGKSPVVLPVTQECETVKIPTQMLNGEKNNKTINK